MAESRPPNRLRVLGAADLRGADGQEVGSVLVQPKRTAVLAYLALARPRSFRRRDALQALFWPELDSERARIALNKCVHHLRRSLGAESIAGRGDGEVGLEWTRWWCDVAAFEDALDAGEPRAALDLYAGELLPGFHVSEADEFERWLEGERARLHDRARAAAWALLARAEEVGDVEAAAAWARRTLEVAPDDERALRALITLLDQAGDRVGALREYEAFVRRLAGALEIEPAPETLALAEAIRLRVEARPVIPRAAAQVSSGSADFEPLGAGRAGAPSPSVKRPGGTMGQARSWRQVLAGSRFRAGAVGFLLALATLIGLGVAVGDGRRAGVAGAEPGSDVVAVLPFAYRGGGDVAYLGEAVAMLVSANMDGAGSLRTVEARALAQAAGTRSAPPTGQVAAEVARRFGASLYVLGNITETAGRVRITASLYEQEERRPPVRATAEGETSRIFELADALTAQLLVARAEASGATLSRAAERLTRSVPALRAYLEGEAELRGGRYRRAAEAFERAVQADSAFALAYWRLSVAAYWAGGPDALVTWGAAEALRRGGRLSARERLHVRGFQYYVQRQPGQAEPIYRRLVAGDSTDAEAWLYLAEVGFHYGPWYGRAVVDTRARWERVLALDPQNAGALLHLLRIAALEGRREEFDRLTARLDRLAPEPYRAAEVRAIRAFAFGDDAARRAAADELSRSDPGALRSAILRIAETSNDLAGVAELLLPRVLHPTATTPRPTADDWLWQAHFLAARGRLRAASAVLDTAATLNVPRALEYRAALAALAFYPVPRQDLVAMRASLRALAPPAEAERLRPLSRPFLVGVLSLRLGDSAAADRELRLLDDSSGQAAADSASARALAALLRAELERARGRPREALTALGKAPLFAHVFLSGPMTYQRPYERWLRAELAEQLGLEEDALAWYATFPENGAYELTHLAPSHLRRAEIYARTGEAEKAAWHYARFLGLWRDSDTELQPAVRRAEQALARLRGR